MSEVQLDVNKLVQKLQNKLAEALTNVAILETRLEQLEELLAAEQNTQSIDSSDNL